MAVFDYSSPSPRSEEPSFRPARWVCIAIIAAAHVLSQPLLYHTGWPDEIRFLLPACLAFVLYFMAIQSRASLTSPRLIVQSVIFSLGVTFLSAWIGLGIAINLFGS